ncbi:PLP-dependent aminotransferase family protein [Luxibacter massiliensis]|uniref:amino acid hydroxymethyltransferase n=1 Tax=Luxibacter massiliensis TaxID=2219695 RepID=UPI000F069A6F|nr:amino acid hydroxymethyltransferase [Luxibacter massiliensis]
MEHENYLKYLSKIYEEYKNFDDSKIPLCAAENFVSPFAMQGLTSRYEGKYISGYIQRNKEKDFIGSDYLEKIFFIANDLASNLFHAKYNDFRSLTGMNTVALILMSMVAKDSKILITDPESGGHGSLPKLCDNLGIRYSSIPFDYVNMQINYEKLNEILLNDHEISYLCFCQSDILQPPDFNLISSPKKIGIIYDATQTLGLIAGSTIPNPLDSQKNMVLIGGTHKTFPGVTCGYVATNSDNIIQKINQNISPNFLRNIQVNNIMSVCLSMIEMLHIGEQYANNIVYIANTLGKTLSNKGIYVKEIADGLYTKTHQIFIGTGKLSVDETYTYFKKYGITLNKRNTKYIKGFRIGVQEIARYGFEKYIDELSELIRLVLVEPSKEKEILTLKAYLAKFKTNKYNVDNIFMEWD